MWAVATRRPANTPQSISTKRGIPSCVRLCPESDGPGATCTKSQASLRRPLLPRIKRNPGGMDEASYDVIVIGAGTTGENVADRAVKGGLSAVIVESELVGGECSY